MIRVHLFLIEIQNWKGVITFMIIKVFLDSVQEKHETSRVGKNRLAGNK